MAQELSSEKLASYLRGASERERRRREAAISRRERGWTVARQAARVLREMFGATRVVVFGSLVHGHWFRVDSDIDIAVAGVPPDRFWHVWAALDDVAEGFEINLVALEDTTGTFRQHIEVEGIEL